MSTGTQLVSQGTQKCAPGATPLLKTGAHRSGLYGPTEGLGPGSTLNLRPTALSRLPRFTENYEGFK